MRFKNHHEPRVEEGPLDVIPRPHESPDRTIRRFMKKVRNDGIIHEFLSHTYHVKPSAKRRRKRVIAESRKK